MHIHMSNANFYKYTVRPFYGSCLWNLYGKATTSLYKTWNIAIRRLCNIPYRTHTRFLDSICNIKHLSFLLKRKFISFIITLLESRNELVQNIVSNSVFNNLSPTGKLLSRILCEYDLGSTNMFKLSFDNVLYCLDKQYHFVHGLSDVDTVHCQIIKEMIECKNNSYHTELSYIEITSLIDYLSTA